MKIDSSTTPTLNPSALYVRLPAVVEPTVVRSVVFLHWCASSRASVLCLQLPGLRHTDGFFDARRFFACRNRGPTKNYVRLPGNIAFWAAVGAWAER